MSIQSKARKATGAYQGRRANKLRKKLQSLGQDAKWIKLLYASQRTKAEAKENIFLA
ncbi:hypothetical protein [Motilimonas eburnea]|uniref:hypothetical protein n=1 Tax=Motilimonas eburnea TaxID=1737488 RepID=UPI001E32E952|nr:hypothetical protein [Motilimonas eburnea]MCE2571704.1 hypothetical protein [Motilimonas eburnea]